MHLPESHATLALASAQLAPQMPQFAVESSRASQPSSESPLQSTHGASHCTSRHLLSTHAVSACVRVHVGDCGSAVHSTRPASPPLPTTTGLPASLAPPSRSGEPPASVCAAP